MAFPKNHKTRRSSGLSPFLPVRASRCQRRLNYMAKQRPREMSRTFLHCPQTSSGRRQEGQCQMLSGVEPCWLIATVRSGEHFTNSQNALLPNGKFEKHTGAGGLKAVLSRTFQRKENLSQTRSEPASFGKPPYELSLTVTTVPQLPS